MINDQTVTALENLFLSLSDKTRLRLLCLMADEEVSVNYLADTLGESQPKISRHLAYLRNAGLVDTRRDGRWIYYAIAMPDDAVAAGVLRMAVGGEQPTQPRRRRIEREETAPSVAEPSAEYFPETETAYEPEPEYYEERKDELEIFLL